MRLPVLGKMGDVSRSGCRMSQGESIKRGQSIILRNLRTTLSHGKGFGTEALSQVVVWYAESKEDTLITEKKILWEGKIGLTNGALKTYGGFDMSYAKTRSINADSVVMEYNVPEYVVNLPAHIDMDRVVVTYHSDARGGLDAKAQQAEVAEYALYPNPVDGQIKINFKTALEAV
jgi:hypothetical protein